MTFIGEAVGMFYARTMPDNMPTGTGFRRRWDGDTQTLTAGDDILVMFADYDHLEVDSAAVFSFVMTGTSGSASVRVTYGTDEEWAPTTASATVTAGTFTVGTGDTVASLPGWDVPTYHATDVLHVVRLEVLSGSVVLDGVRLRIWPPGGYQGGYSDVITEAAVGPYPLTTRYRYEPQPTTYTSDPPGLGGSERVVRPSDGDIAAALADAQTYARGDLDAATQAFVRLTTLSTAANSVAVRFAQFASASRHLDVGTSSEASAAILAERAYFDRVRSAGFLPPGVYGVDWFHHPDLVPGEAGSVRMATAADGYSWEQPTATIDIFGTSHGTRSLILPGDYTTKVYGAADLPPQTEAGETVARDAPFTSGGTVRASVPASIDGPGHVVAFDLPDIDEPVVVMELAHPSLFASIAAVATYTQTDPEGDPILYTGGVNASLRNGKFATLDPATGVGTGFEALSYYLHPGPYRYWTASARRIPLRQFHRDDGLGVTPPRAFGGASRARTNRAFGYD